MIEKETKEQGWTWGFLKKYCHDRKGVDGLGRFLKGIAMIENEMKEYLGFLKEISMIETVGPVIFRLKKINFPFQKK